MTPECWFELGPFTVFDVETTGMNCIRDRIVELSAVRIDTDGGLRRFSTLVNPHRSIPCGAFRVHHISDEMVASAPDFGEIGEDFLTFCAGSTLVAHNARFDLSFLQESLARHRLPQWEGKTLDTLRLARQVLRGLPSYKLQDLRCALRLRDDFEDMQAHRASADVEWTLQLLGIILQRLLRQNDCVR